MTQDTAGGDAAGKRHGVWFWLLVIVGPLVLLCCGGGGIFLYLQRDWIDILSAPPSEREALISKKLEALAPDQMAAADRFLAAVDSDRDDDAWDMTTEGFRAATSREKFGEMTALVRSVVGKCRSRTLRNVNSKATIGGPTVTTLVLGAKFDKGDGSVTFELESASGVLRVRTWRVDSPLFISAMQRGAGK